jgi:hypothetical protein
MPSPEEGFDPSRNFFLSKLGGFGGIFFLQILTKLAMATRMA